MAHCQRRKLDAPASEERVGSDEEGVSPLAHEGGEGRLDLVDVDAPALRREFGFSRRALLLPRFARRAPSSASAAPN